MKTKLRQAVVLGLLLIAAGLGVFVIKAARLGYPLTPGAMATIWDFEIYLEFDGRNEPARLEVYLPAADVQRSFPQEQFYNGPFGVSLVSEPETRNRKAVWTYRYPSNRKVLRYMAQTTGETGTTPLPVSFTQSEPDVIPFEADLIKRQAFIVWAGDLRRRSADDRSFAGLAISETFENRTAGEEYADEIAVLLDGRTGDRARLELARHTLQSAGIPARIANGVYLTDARRRVDIKSWLEYHVDGEDFRYFPDEPQGRFFTIWYGAGGLVTVTGIDELDVQIGLQSQRDAAIDVRRLEVRVVVLGLLVAPVQRIRERTQPLSEAPHGLVGREAAVRRERGALAGAQQRSLGGLAEQPHHAELVQGHVAVRQPLPVVLLRAGRRVGG